MARLNVSVPDELVALVKEQLPGLNVSAVLQEGPLECVTCRARLDRYALVIEALGKFYSDALWELDPLIRREGTAEGAARILKQLAANRGVPEADKLPLPRPNRANRQAARVKDFPASA